MDDSYVTRLWLDDGRFVRVSETIGTASDLLVDAERCDGWAAFTDPGDEREKLVRASRVTCVEMEPDERP